MKRKIHKSIAFLLMLCMLLPLAFSTTVYAITNQEAYYLSVLRPSNIKNINQSYPVKLIVNQAVWTGKGEKQSMEFFGTCGVSAEISDEEMLAILKDALSSVGSYKELQDPVDDKVLIQQTLEKLKVSQEDIDKMIENWQKLLGIDNVVSLLSGKVPDIAANDAINAVIDGAQGNIPGLPGMPGIGNVIDGAFISYEQWQKDKAKWKSIADMYEAKQRLRTYNAAVQEKINEYFSEHGNWTVKINSQDWAELRFQFVDGNKQIWTADIELTKNDGSYGNITGTYTGKFAFKMDTDLSGYDKNFGNYLFDDIRTGGTVMTETKAELVLRDCWSSRKKLQNVEWSGKPSEMSCVFEIPDCELNLALPAGTSRAFFEIPVDKEEIYMTEYNRNIDRTIYMYASDVGWSDEAEMNISMIDDQQNYSGTYQFHNHYTGETRTASIDNPDWSLYNMEDIVDYAPDMVLIIDMLGD